MPFQFTIEDAAELSLIIEEAQTAGTKYLSDGVRGHIRCLAGAVGADQP